ncbi:pirin family protein [uncultured Massilia sp.]|uniref:pirin family protein n=1 Tax=uncultured Massilia sp. TaxID=169973 RepID=UPI0025E0BF0E|nr:pirin family protein [uncultured Massilia sp.]
MIDHRPYAALGGNDLGWLKARLHVAIHGLGHPAHGAIGPLRAWNDDEFAPRSGFPMHRHQDVEILTYVRRGAITHEDSLGNRATVAAGDVQAMSAGSGIRHAEFNAEDVDTALYQIWLRPRATGGAPSWRTRRFPRHQRAGRLTVLASGDARDVERGALAIDADARLLGATLRAGQTIAHRLAPGLRAYLVSTAGRATVNGVALAPRDGAGIAGEAVLAIAALEDTEIVLLELG